MAESETLTPLIDKMLKKFQDKNLEVSVYLANGIKISGRIIEFDPNTLILSSDAGPEGVSITRSSIATLTHRTDDQRHRQEGNSRSPAPVRRTAR
jgi:RNA chaperone Hfq